MDAHQYETVIVLELPSVQIYEIRGKYQKLLQQGNLQVLEIEQYGLTFLKLNGFQYTLQKNIPIMTKPVQNDNGLPLKMFVLPCVDHFYYGVIIDQTQKDLTDVFELIIANKCQLVQPTDKSFELFQADQNNQAVQHANQSTQESHQEDMMKRSGVVRVKPEEIQQRVNQQYGGWNNVGQGEAKKDKSIPEYIIQGGELLKDGLITGAKLVSEGVISGGQYLQGKITTKETKEINPSTMNKVRIANTGAKAMYMYTRVQVEALVSMGKIVGEEAGKQLADSETGKKVQSHKNYEDAKQIGKATLFAFVTVYDGMYEALGELGKSCAQATTDLVDARYGNQAGQLSRESFEVAGQIGQLARVYKDVAAKAIIQETSNQK